MGFGNNKQSFIENKWARISFALIAVIILCLSVISAVYIAMVNREAMDRESDREAEYDINSELNNVHTSIETEAEYIAMETIVDVVEGRLDEKELPTEFSNRFDMFISKCTDDGGHKEND